MRRLLSRLLRPRAVEPTRITVDIDRDRARLAVAEITESQFFRDLEASKRLGRGAADDAH